MAAWGSQQQQMLAREREKQAAIAAAKFQSTVSAILHENASDLCFRKCITTWQEPDFTKGESLCVDRCLSKYMTMVELISARHQEVMEKTAQEQLAMMEGEQRLMQAKNQR